MPAIKQRIDLFLCCNSSVNIIVMLTDLGQRKIIGIFRIARCFEGQSLYLLLLAAGFLDNALGEGDILEIMTRRELRAFVHLPIGLDLGTRHIV